MHSLAGVWRNHVLIAGLIGWFLAQTLKIPIYYLVERKWDFHRFHGAGGMPSSHTAMTVAATIMVGALEGFHSALFGVSALFCCVVMYDATGVRRETGRQATIINRILDQVLIKGKPISDVELKELVGHKPIEVAAGAFLGIAIAGIYILALTNQA